MRAAAEGNCGPRTSKADCIGHRNCCKTFWGGESWPIPEEEAGGIMWFFLKYASLYAAVKRKLCVIHLHLTVRTRTCPQPLSSCWQLLSPPLVEGLCKS